MLQKPRFLKLWNSSHVRLKRLSRTRGPAKGVCIARKLDGATNRRTQKTIKKSGSPEERAESKTLRLALDQLPTRECGDLRRSILATLTMVRHPMENCILLFPCVCECRLLPVRVLHKKKREKKIVSTRLLIIGLTKESVPYPTNAEQPSVQTGVDFMCAKRE